MTLSTLTDTERLKRGQALCSCCMELHIEASIMAAAPPAASGLCYSTSAPEARRVRGLRRDAERAQIAETVSKAHALFPRSSQERGAAMIQAPGLLHIGGAAYFVWVDSPDGECIAHRHGEVHRRTTSALRPASKVSG